MMADMASEEHHESASEDISPQGPLAGVRVIDLTTIVMGPMACRVLGDLGAEVIKVETAEGDFMRHFEPKRSEGMSAFTLNINRNKRSMVLDLKSKAGRQAMLDLSASSDVLVTNMRPAALDRLNLGYDDLRAVKPNLIYCSAVGFGSGGPYAGQAAYDDVIQAVSGLASMAAWTGDEPAFAPSIIADKVSALHIAYAVSAALFRRSTSGIGDHIEIPMAEVMAAFNLTEHLNGHTLEPKQEPFSYPRLRTKHRKPRRSSDGWVCLMPYSDQNWQDFFHLVERNDLASDPRFATINDRITHIDALYGHLDELTQGKTTAEWLEICDRLSIPATPVNELEDIADDPHFEAVGLLEVAEHPSEGPYRVIKDPVTFRSGNGGLRRHAPRIGQHTEEILSELGYDKGAIKRIIDA